MAGSSSGVVPRVYAFPRSQFMVGGALAPTVFRASSVWRRGLPRPLGRNPAARREIPNKSGLPAFPAHGTRSAPSHWSPPR